VALALALGFTLFIALALAADGTLRGVVNGSFHAIFPHNVLVALRAIRTGVRLRGLRAGCRRAPFLAAGRGWLAVRRGIE
jgi:hypothetical protein